MNIGWKSHATNHSYLTSGQVLLLNLFQMPHFPDEKTEAEKKLIALRDIARLPLSTKVIWEGSVPARRPQ